MREQPDCVRSFSQMSRWGIGLAVNTGMIWPSETGRQRFSFHTGKFKYCFTFSQKCSWSGREREQDFTHCGHVDAGRGEESRGQGEVEDFQPVLNFLAALGSLGRIVYPHHSQSGLTASLVSLVPFLEAALESGTLTIGRLSESCPFCTGNILQRKLPLVLWPISTSPETIRVCRNDLSHKKKVFQTIETWYLAISI